MYLLIEEYNRSYFRTSNVILNFSVTKSTRASVHSEVIECGYATVSAEGLFHLFVLHHKIVKGTPRRFYVKITPQEGHIFNMIAKTGFWRKRSYWSQVFKKDGKEILKELEGVLPLWVLRSKLLVDKK